MKRTLLFSLCVFLGTAFLQGIAPYVQIAALSGSVQEAREIVVASLQEKGYEVLGEYQPGNLPGLYVVGFTSQELVAFCKQTAEQGMLAAAMKIGFQEDGDKVKISLVNPEYLFYAYFREKMDDADFKSKAISISEDIKKDLELVGTMSLPFGGDEEIKKLVKYRYMAGMPNFEKQVELADFDSFSEGLTVIRKNLAAGKGNTTSVYELIDEDAGIAVIGVGLLDAETGESHFLPIIGEDHVAAMPYEIILENNKAKMLHGRFRFAVHWPELTMGTFTKIMSSPGDVEDTMKALVE